MPRARCKLSVTYRKRPCCRGTLRRPVGLRAAYCIVVQPAQRGTVAPTAAARSRMAAVNDVLTIILGGGRGTRLFPLTQQRSKPAVPIGGKWRLIDIPISNCLHAGLERIYVLTQFNSASLNRHIAQTYRMDVFSGGFVEVLAAEQTPGGRALVPGHGRRRAPGRPALPRHRRRVLPDPRRRPHLPHGLRRTHRSRTSNATRTSRSPPSPCRPKSGTQMGIFSFDVERPDRRLRGEARRRRGSPRCGRARRRTRRPGCSHPTSRFWRRWASTCSRATCCYDVLRSTTGRSTSAARSSRAPSTRHRVHAYLYRGYWADVGTVQSFYDVNLMLTRRGARRSTSSTRARPIYTRPRFLPAARLHDCQRRRGARGRGRVPRQLRGAATASSACARPSIRRRTVSRARCCSAPTTTTTSSANCRSASARTPCSIA